MTLPEPSLKISTVQFVTAEEQQKLQAQHHAALPLQEKDTPDSGSPASLSEDEPSSTFWQRVKKMKSWTSFWFLTGVGSACLIAPATILIALDNTRIPNLTNQASPLLPDPVYLNSPITNIIRFSFWFSTLYISFLIFWFSLQLTPVFITRAIVSAWGYCSEEVTRKLEFIPPLHPWFVVTLTLAINVPIFAIIFTQYALVPAWLAVLNTICVLLILSVCLSVQRVVVQKIAYDFHHVAYQDRLDKSRKESKILDNLKRAVRKIGVIPDSVDSQSEQSRRKLLSKSPNVKAGYSLKVSNMPESIPNLVARSESHLDVSQTPNPETAADEAGKNAGPIEAPDGFLESVCVVPAADERTEQTVPDVPAGVPHSRRPHDTETLVSVSTQSSLKNEKGTLQAIQIGGVGRKNRLLQLSGDHEARKFSEKLYFVLKKPMRQICLLDFYPYFTKEEEAIEAFSLFDRDKSGHVSYEEIRTTVSAVYKERRDLNAALSDLSQALGHLNIILYGFSCLITLLIAMPIFGIRIESILPFTSLFLALSFIFGGALKNVFDCVIFVFNQHPFDAGDKIMLEGSTYIVEELSLLTSVLKQEGKISYIPNSSLAGKNITNIRRSGDMTEYVKIFVPYGTQTTQMRQVHERLREFVRSHPLKYHPNTNMELVEIGCHNVYQFSIEHKGNWQDGGKRWNRRTEFMMTLHEAMQEFEIKGRTCYDG
ncbi:hypothetical protein HDV03_005489 [Kappamyces sp. JEL0829]|nr:hypothetical protein HDV03_005489 [Kappamyces sp. JEL0829]